jgi:hypothetical protein
VEFRLQRIPGDGQIELPSDSASRARQIAILARGFVAIDALLRPATSKSKKPVGRASGKNKKRLVGTESAEPGTPGTLLAGILGQPETASHFDSYACGDQGAVAEILETSRDTSKNLNHESERRLIVALGVWLADLVMQYPGVLVNEVAAASYLDIHTSDFAKPSVRKVFESAEYRDLPFADPDRPMWWRHLLDDLVNEAGAPSGRDMCADLGIKRLRFCPCSVDPKLRAGYFCMATGEPLSDENSSGRVSWFPAGADLARLTKAMHRKLAPWIGS